MQNTSQITLFERRGVRGAMLILHNVLPALVRKRLGGRLAFKLADQFLVRVP